MLTIPSTGNQCSLSSDSTCHHHSSVLWWYRWFRVMTGSAGLLRYLVLLLVLFAYHPSFLHLDCITNWKFPLASLVNYSQVMEIIMLPIWNCCSPIGPTWWCMSTVTIKRLNQWWIMDLLVSTITSEDRTTNMVSSLDEQETYMHICTIPTQLYTLLCTLVWYQLMFVPRYNPKIVLLYTKWSLQTISG